MGAQFLQRLAAAIFASICACAAAQAPHESWAVSTYGPGTSQAFLGCGSCASDQRTIAVDAGGNVVVAGYTDTSTLSDIMAVKYDGANGAVLWQQTFDDASSSYDQAWGLALDAAGNAIVTGYAWNGTEYDIKTIKYASADGSILWQNTFTGPASGIDFGIAIGTDAAGNAFVGGKVWNGSNDDLKVVKFAAADGAVLWDKTYTGPAGFNEYVYALAVDGAGNVIVTGEEQLSTTDSDWKTIKYAADDGAVLWQASYAGAALGLDLPYSIRVDANDDVVIAGDTNNGTDFDGKIIKYSGADGSVLWEKTFAGPGGGDDIYYSVALDGAGNALVSGFTFAGAASNDWIVAKYAASDGALLWQKTYNGTGDLSDVSVAITVDAFGNAIAGGRSNNSSDPANRDMQAVKFAGADGSIIWSYTYGGSAGGFDRVAAVAWIPGAAFLAGESLETGEPPGWRIVKLDDPRIRPGLDYDGDTKGDLLWANTDGRAAIWLMNGVSPASTAEIIGAGTGWSVVQVADFNGDGKSDLVWQHTDGRVAIYLMNGTAPSSTQQLLNAGPWSVVQTPDLNGDGKADLLFQNTDGSAAAWTMNGTTVTGGATLMGPGTGWSVIKVADFDGDGNDDLLWKHTDGRHAIWLMNGLAVKQSTQILNAGNWTAVQVADLDGDGKADIVWQNTDGSVAAWLMNGTAMASGTGILGAGTGWSVVKTGDFDGDGRADLVFQHTDGRAAIYLMNGLTPTTTTQILNAGGGWSAERILDLNGDGKSDIVWQNADGRVAVWLMNGTTMTGGSGILGTGTGWSVSAVSQ